MPIHVLIPCAGSGSRLAGAVPKQYLRVAGAELVVHTARAFLACPAVDGRVVAVVQPGDDTAQALLPDAVRVAAVGGATRADSVRQGLEWLLADGADPRDWVLVHDAARCGITPALIGRLLDACADDPVGGLLALPLPDTLKRAGLWLAQTPQMFRVELLLRALRAAGDGVTDEASAVEALGLRPRLVPGSAANFKVTYPDDLALAEALLAARAGKENGHA